MTTTPTVLPTPTEAPPERPTMRPTSAAQRVVARIVGYSILIFFALVFIYPFVIQLASSFKTEPDAAANPLSPVPDPATTDSVVRIFEGTDFARWMFNSVVVTVLVTVGRVFLDALAGYALARLRFRGRAAIFATVLAMMAVPGVVLLIPKFLVLKQVGLYDSYAGLVLPLLVDATGVFIMKPGCWPSSSEACPSVGGHEVPSPGRPAGPSSPARSMHDNNECDIRARPSQAVPRSHGRRRSRPGDRARRGLRPARTERCRKDDHCGDSRGLPAAQRRRGERPRGGPRAGHGRMAHRHRNCPSGRGRRGRADGGRNRVDTSPATTRTPALRRPRSRWSGSPSRHGAGFGFSPADSVGVSMWPSASSGDPGCCSSTSRRPASTPRRAVSSGTFSGRWPPRARRSCSPRTTWRRPRRSRVGSRSSRPGGSSPPAVRRRWVDAMRPRPPSAGWTARRRGRSRPPIRPGSWPSCPTRYGGTVPGLTVSRPTLEDVYLDLIGSNQP